MSESCPHCGQTLLSTPSDPMPTLLCSACLETILVAVQREARRRLELEGQLALEEEEK